ncbi:hypothetical protein HDU93_006489, partial [Gonapodya sp. JEL0774]
LALGLAVISPREPLAGISVWYDFDKVLSGMYKAIEDRSRTPKPTTSRKKERALMGARSVAERCIAIPEIAERILDFLDMNPASPELYELV